MCEIRDRLTKTILLGEFQQGGALATRDDQTINGAEIIPCSDFNTIRAYTPQGSSVSGKVSLNCQYSYHYRATIHESATNRLEPSWRRPFRALLRLVPRSLPTPSSNR